MTKKIFYNKFSRNDKTKFLEMFVCLNNVVLAMIKSGVFVLPYDKKNNIKSSLLHKKIEQKSKQEALKKYEYDNIISNKEALLYCIGDLEKRKLLNLLFKDIIVKKNDGSLSFKLILNKEQYSKLNENDKNIFKKDILFLEKSMNIVGNNFQKKLPIAIKKRKEILSKIRHKKIPEKARVKNTKIDNADNNYI